MAIATGSEEEEFDSGPHAIVGMRKKILRLRQERDAQTETVDLEAENERLRTARATHEKSRHADSCWVGFAPTREKHLSTAH